MKTKEEILKEELSEDILQIIEQKDKPEEMRYFKRYILDAMEQYANQFRKKDYISNTQKIDYCKDCNDFNECWEQKWTDVQCTKYNNDI